MPEILADVYKKGILAGHFSRTDDGATAYTYASTYLETNSKPLSPTLPLSTDSYRREGGALPPIFYRAFTRRTSSNKPSETPQNFSR